MSLFKSVWQNVPRGIAHRITPSQSPTHLHAISAAARSTPPPAAPSTPRTPPHRGSTRAFSATPSRAKLPAVDDAYKRNTVHDLLSLKGKVTVVTGGGRGVGLALARGCVEVGGNVAVLDALPIAHPDFEEMKKEFPESRIEYYQTNVADLPTLTKSFDSVVADFGRIDSCVTAAGIVLDKPFLEHGWDETLRVQMVNTMGTFFAAQLAAKQMVKQKTPGSIVMIASIAAHHAVPSQHLSGYSCSKGAVHALMQQLAVELAPMQIRVNSVSPGYIFTDMTAGLGVQYPEIVALFESEPPMKRMGDRCDLKTPVVHLLSDAAAYTTG
ncbi:hypothetical protein LTR28_001469, partial [Elasticomyces elasticus]